MFFIVYVSSATAPFSKTELLALLESSRKNNASLGISGMLLYKDGNFLQVLEGEERVIKNLYAKIAKDPRHKGILRLFEANGETREFPDWSMGFRDLNSPEVLATPGFNDFLNVTLTTEDLSSQPSRVRKLLSLFKQNM